MLDIVGNLASVIITLIIVAGFVACGAVFLFELGTLGLFMFKHSFRGPRPAGRQR